MTNLREIVAAYCKEDVSEITDSDIIEVVTECTSEVWCDSYVDHHRWYSLQDVVVELEGHYIAYQKYIIQGDMGMRDMDLEYSVDDFSVVQKKTRIIEETYYDTI